MPPTVTKRNSNGVKPKAKAKGVLDRIAPLTVSDGIKMNIYGKSSTGKTTLWSSFPGKILAIILSGGKKPGELRSINTPEMKKKVDCVYIQDSAEIREVVDYVGSSGNYATVVLDHTTSLQDMVLREILGLEELPAQKGWGMASQQQYGQCSLQMKEILRALLNLDGNVVLISQEREFNTDVEGDLLMPYVAGAMSPSVVGWLNPAVDYIVQTFIREQTVKKATKVGGKTVTTEKKTGKAEYCLRTGPNAVYTTKFRVPKGSVELPEVIVDPTFDKIMALINGG